MRRLAVILIALLSGLTLAQAALLPLSRIGVDTELANISVDQTLSGGPPPQGIPALGFSGDRNGAAGPSPSPSFVSQQEAGEWLDGAEPVIAFTANGETRAYPLQILTWHEIVNDTVGGVPVAVTFCPLCNSSLAFDRRVPLGAEALARLQQLNPAAVVASAEELLDADFLAAYTDQEGAADSSGITAATVVTFGVSGTLINSNLLMFDTASSTLWSQILGQGNVGTLTGTALLRYPAQVISYEAFREVFPEALVLSRDTGFSRNYGANPYVGYDRADTPPFLFNGISDGRLPPKARVVSVERLGESAAYPFEVLSEVHVINDTVADLPVAIFWQQGTASALDGRNIATSADVGAVGAFERTVDGQELTFSWNGEAFIDDQTGSSWNLSGQAVAGALQGEVLQAVVHDNTLWFAWAAFKPDTRIVISEDLAGQ